MGSRCDVFKDGEGNRRESVALIRNYQVRRHGVVVHCGRDILFILGCLILLTSEGQFICGLILWILYKV